MLQLGLHLNGRTLARVDDGQDDELMGDGGTFARRLVLGQRNLAQIEPVARAAALGTEDAVQTIVSLGLEALAYLLG